MVTITINQLSLFPWLILIIFSSQFEVNEASKAEVLQQYWLSNCFLKGYALKNIETVNCKSLDLPSNLTSVKEFESECLGYYQLGCGFGQRSLFCSIGVSKVISDYPRNANFSCAEIAILPDETNLAFECCSTCKVGIIDAPLKDKCEIKNLSSLTERAQQRCCEVHTAFTRTASFNSNAVVSNLVPSSDNITIDEISTIALENDIKINKSLAFKLDSSTTTISPVLPIEDATSKDSSVLTTATSEPELSTDQPIINNETINNDSKLVNNGSTTSPVTETPKMAHETVSSPKSTIETTESTPSPSSPTPIAARNSDCDPGYHMSRFSEECEDTDECEEIADVCPQEKCFNTKGSYKCCPLGTEMDSKNECIYIDQCSKDRCYQSVEDQHYCVNYFVGRECIDKQTEGYKFLEGRDDIQELIDRKNKSIPRYLELSQKEIVIKENEKFSKHGLIRMKFKEETNCEWSFNLDSVWAPNDEDKIKEKQFDHKTDGDKFLVEINGLVKPQSVAISVTCDKPDYPYYRNTIYFTFRPETMSP